MGSPGSINEPDTPTVEPTEPKSINEPAPTEPPTIESLDPEEAMIGDEADVTMHVYGSGFTDKSVITFNGGDEPTVYVSETELTTIVKPSTAQTPGVYPVTVRNADGQESTPYDFEFLDA